MRVLLVEDDALLGDGVKAGLKQAGFAVDWTQDGQAAKLALETEEYAVIVLDLGLPKLRDVYKRQMQFRALVRKVGRWH